MLNSSDSISYFSVAKEQPYFSLSRHWCTNTDLTVALPSVEAYLKSTNDKTTTFLDIDNGFLFILAQFDVDKNVLQARINSDVYSNLMSTIDTNIIEPINNIYIKKNDINGNQRIFFNQRQESKDFIPDENFKNQLFTIIFCEDFGNFLEVLVKGFVFQIISKNIEYTTNIPQDFKQFIKDLIIVFIGLIRNVLSTLAVDLKFHYGSGHPICRLIDGETDTNEYFNSIKEIFNNLEVFIIDSQSSIKEINDTKEIAIHIQKEFEIEPAYGQYGVSTTTTHYYTINLDGKSCILKDKTKLKTYLESLNLDVFQSKSYRSSSTDETAILLTKLYFKEQVKDGKEAITPDNLLINNSILCLSKTLNIHDSYESFNEAFTLIIFEHYDPNKDSSFEKFVKPLIQQIINKIVQEKNNSELSAIRGIFSKSVMHFSKFYGADKIVGLFNSEFENFIKNLVGLKDNIKTAKKVKKVRKVTIDNIPDLVQEHSGIGFENVENKVSHTSSAYEELLINQNKKNDDVNSSNSTLNAPLNNTENDVREIDLTIDEGKEVYEENIQNDEEKNIKELQELENKSTFLTMPLVNEAIDNELAEDKPKSIENKNSDVSDINPAIDEVKEVPEENIKELKEIEDKSKFLTMPPVIEARGAIDNELAEDKPKSIENTNTDTSHINSADNDKNISEFNVTFKSNIDKLLKCYQKGKNTHFEKNILAKYEEISNYLNKGNKKIDNTLINEHLRYIKDGAKFIKNENLKKDIELITPAIRYGKYQKKIEDYQKKLGNDVKGKSNFFKSVAPDDDEDGLLCFNKIDELVSKSKDSKELSAYRGHKQLVVCMAVAGLGVFTAGLGLIPFFALSYYFTGRFGYAFETNGERIINDIINDEEAYQNFAAPAA